MSFFSFGRKQRVKTELLCGRGARLCDKRSEERNTNREGVASGRATINFY